MIRTSRLSSRLRRGPAVRNDDPAPVVHHRVPTADPPDLTCGDRDQRHLEEVEAVGPAVAHAADPPGVDRQRRAGAELLVRHGAGPFVAMEFDARTPGLRAPGKVEIEPPDDDVSRSEGQELWLDVKLVRSARIGHREGNLLADGLGLDVEEGWRTPEDGAVGVPSGGEAL